MSGVPDAISEGVQIVIYGEMVLAVGLPILTVFVAIWVYRDANANGHDELAPFVAVAIGGLFLAGSVPGLVALTVAAETAIQGFPTALRILPGLAVLGLYIHLR